MTTSPILIVGAGPTGLVLALFLAKLGVRARIIDRADAPGKTSRAMAVQARVLEFYRQIGLADDVVAAGIKMDHIVMRRNGRPVARAPLGDFGRGISPFPFVLSFPQDDHERLLTEHLARAGVPVERNAELVRLTQGDGRVHATLRRDGAEEQVDADYACGCDGARSAVRQALGAEFRGGTYDRVFYVADAHAAGEAVTGGVNACLSSDGFGLVFPVRSSGTVRLIGVVPAEHETKESITYDDIAPDVARHTRLRIEAVDWFSTYRVHHRVVDHFRHGRVFLAGDAAHVHSPVGGQGMNTGIGDAVNLAWKLAAVVRGRGSAKLLDTYEPERLAFARTLVATTDRLFQVFAGRSWASWVARGYLIPRAAAFGFTVKPVQRFVFRAVSQVRVAYHDSELSSGAAGAVRGGDRLPWVPGGGGGGGGGGEHRAAGDNFDPLRSLDWHVHVYGQAAAELRTMAGRRGLPLFEFPWNARACAAGLAQGAAYLVRPDGHVAVAASAHAPASIGRLLDEYGVVGAPAPAR